MYVIREQQQLAGLGSLLPIPGIQLGPSGFVASALTPEPSCWPWKPDFKELVVSVIAM